MTLTTKQLKQLREAPIGPVGNRLAAAIEIADTTSAEVARSTEFTPQYVSDVACGRWDDIKVGNARKFADYFGCQIEDIFPARHAVAS